MSGAREQVARLLALVPYLQTRGEVSVEEAARQFGVTPRTLRKDLQVLWYCGLPGLGMGDLIEIDFDALEGEGVVRLTNAEFLTRPLRLDSSEAAALMVALRTLRESSGEAEREVVDRALGKIEAAAGEAASVAGQVEVHLPDADARLRELRGDLERAVHDHRQVRLGYYTPARDALTERVVDPIALATAQGRTYLDAWCHHVQGRRLFRLDRISAAEVLATAAVPHPELAPLDLSEGIFHGSPDDLLATLELRPEARWVAEYYPVESAVEGPGDRMTVTLRAGDRTWLVRLMLRLGGTARLVEPADLAEEVKETARRALRQYRPAMRTMVGHPPRGETS